MKNSEISLREEFARLEDDWEAASSYRSIFIDECLQTLDELTEALLALEAGGGKENIEQLFIAAHRIKGSAASIGLNRPAKLAHLMEDLLQMLVYDGRLPSSKVADGLLACTDGLREYVSEMSTGCPEGDQFATIAQQLLEAKDAFESTISRGDTEAASEQANETETEEDAEERVETAVIRRCEGIGPELHQRVADALREDQHDNVLVGCVLFEPDLPLVGLKARLVFTKLSNAGEIHYVDPSQADMEALDDIPALSFGISTDKPVEDLRQLLRVAGVLDVFIEPMAVRHAGEKPASAVQPVEKVETPEAAVVPVAAEAASSSAGPAAPRTLSAAGSKATETLRVDVERLDSLMNLAGQLAICKARVSQIGDKLKNIVAVDKSLPILDRIASELKRIDIAVGGDAKRGVNQADAEEIGMASRRILDQLETVQREVGMFAQARSSVNNLFETIHLLDSVSDGIRQSVMDMRMLPIGPLFTPIPPRDPRYHTRKRERRPLRDQWREDGTR